MKSANFSISDIPLQSASLDVWDKKYRLKNKDGVVIDHTIADTYQRIALTLAAVEKNPAQWQELFLWALENGALPGGRIIANAGAGEHRYSTSTINCTVSGIIEDSMDGILKKLHEAGLTLKVGAGIGYCFSTLRPRGAYVAGAGAQTSGPLSFMDIYDKMCFTISSAGGRRGAQMATFDISHPDIIEFIQAKREPGRLRQFNLSVLVTQAFMESLQQGQKWILSFNGKEYRRVDAKEIWDLIMQSTYDYAEPGIMFIDHINQMNNLYWCEDIRATNPCVTSDTWIQTDQGAYQVKDLINKTVSLRMYNIDYQTKGFFYTGTKPVVKLQTKQGHVLRATRDHLIKTPEGWRAISDLEIGDKVVSCNDYEALAEIISINDDGVEAVFDIQVPEFNAFNANGLYVHNCGEVPLPPYGSCLLGSINLTKFIKNPFAKNAYFDYETYRKVIRVFTRMLDNVVEINGLPLAEQRKELELKRRHGMGYLGLGSAMTMLKIKYGSKESLEFTEKVTKELAIEGWRTGVELAKEKGPAPILIEEFDTVDGKKFGKELLVKSRYMQRIAEVAPELVREIQIYGSRFSHHTAIAPTGTISLALANNASNGIEPSFAHSYSRNIIKEGKKTKETVDVYSCEYLLYREIFGVNAALPDYFITANDIDPKKHIDVQATAQYWIDASISKTINVPADYLYDEFQDLYRYAYEKKLKGCTTFRYNPEQFSGVLVQKADLEKTIYRFTLEDGTIIEIRGNEEVEYDGETHTAMNLYDALKEGYYGRF